MKDNLGKYLDEIEKGEKIIIRKDEKDIACLSQISRIDWRDKMTIRPKLMVSPDQIIEPLTDIWEDYI